MDKLSGLDNSPLLTNVWYISPSVMSDISSLVSVIFLFTTVAPTAVFSNRYFYGSARGNTMKNLPSYVGLYFVMPAHMFVDVPWLFVIILCVVTGFVSNTYIYCFLPRSLELMLMASGSGCVEAAAWGCRFWVMCGVGWAMGGVGWVVGGLTSAFYRLSRLGRMGLLLLGHIGRPQASRPIAWATSRALLRFLAIILRPRQQREVSLNSRYSASASLPLCCRR